MPEYSLVKEILSSEKFPYKGRDFPSEGRQSPLMRYPNNLKALRKSKKWTIDRAAAEMRMSYGGYLKIERGENRLTTTSIANAVRAFGVGEGEVIGPSGQIQSDEQKSDVVSQKTFRTVPVHVRGETAAGRWFEHDEVIDEAPESIPVIPGRYNSLEQFAYRIVGPSMDKRKITHGDYVICVPYFDARIAPENGDVVVVERRRGHLIERTCKELQVVNGGFELWPRSSDPRFQEPIKIPDQRDPHAEDGTEVEIVGLVIAVHMPI